MNEEIKRYEIISKAATNTIIAQTLVMILTSGILLFINQVIELNKIWNICFMFPIYIMYFSASILNFLINFRVGRYSLDTIKNKSFKMSNLLFASNIIFFILIFTAFMYILMSIILFS